MHSRPDLIWPVDSFKTSMSTIHPSTNYHLIVFLSGILNPSSQFLVSLPIQYICIWFSYQPHLYHPLSILHPHRSLSIFNYPTILPGFKLLQWFEPSPSVLPSLHSHSKNPPKIIQSPPVIPLLSNVVEPDSYLTL
jgi:hypothetical protein